MDPPLPENDSERPSAATDGEHEEKHARGEFFRFRPVAFTKHRIRRHQKRAAAEKKDGRYYVQQAGLAAAAILFLFAWFRGYIDSNTVIAVFTIVMAYTTWLNWEAMRIQNDIMESQLEQADKTIAHMTEQLNQAKTASAQTDAMIENMQFAQRAWVSVRKKTLDPLEIGKPVKAIVQLTNTGSTPARVLACGFTVEYLPRGTQPPEPDVTDEEMELAAVKSVLAPKGFIHFSHTTDWDLTQDQKTVIDNREFRIFLCGWIYYRDAVQGKLRKTVFCFNLNVEDDTLRYYMGRNDMT